MRMVFLAMAFLLVGCATGPGPFSGRGDIGNPSTAAAGSDLFDPVTRTVAVTGGGQNIWGAHDDFHFVWKKASGDFSMAATVAFDPATPGAIEHRKAVLMIRQSLDPGSAYADAAIHGNGMTALQWRDAANGNSFEIMANANAPRRVRIEKRGDYFSMSVGSSDADLQPAGGACKVALTGDFYVGLGVSSHDKTRVETARFSDIVFAPLVAPVAASAGGHNTFINTLEVYQLSSRDRAVVYTVTQPQRIEAPNWSKDDANLLLFNAKGKLFKVPARLPNANPPAHPVNPTPEPVDLGILSNINNDHVLSFDGKMIAVSDQSQGDKKSSVWTYPLGGAPGAQAKRITENTPSYCHGWSPDGQTLVYAAPRNNVWDIYALPSAGVAGATEKRLTTTGHNDGPEYSPDGQWIYFNSDRSGLMQIWRMKPDGSEQERVVNDDFNDWFPHISPNGQNMVFIAFDKTIRSGDHPESKDVAIKLMNMNTKALTTVAKLFGGQGTINVPSWSPNSQYFAFVSYQMVPQ